ncbi:hypothetical protein DFS33DRAFT_1345260 [Desarmillaria ectypa]|nr:hypothetical protein DFS33DRAFT_1345260 [Desarmillaria ectypa]
MERYLSNNVHPRTDISVHGTCIDSVITYGTQVVVIPATLRHLENVQIAFIRGLIHVHNRSIAAILFSETEFTRIRYRRLVLAFRYFVRLFSER